MAFAGQRTRVASRISTGLFFILLTTLSFTAALPVSPIQTSSGKDSSGESTQPGSLGSQTLSPQTVGATPLSGMSLPKTVVSNVDNLLGAGGVIQSSPDNLTLYNAGARLRLLGGLLPDDELINQANQILSSHLMWGVQANASGIWIPLTPISSSFIVIGTNSTGSYVVRSMQVNAGLYSGSFKIFYKALAAGPLSWDLEFTPSSEGQYRVELVISNVTSVAQLSSTTRLAQLNFVRSNYTLSWSDIPSSLNATTSISAAQFTLSIDLGNVPSGISDRIDPYIVATTSFGGSGTR